MKYFSCFVFPTEEMEDNYLWDLGNTCSYYPFRVLSEKQLGRIDFAPITILYGGNGSGKSTALNVIAERLGLSRDSSFSSSEFFQDYVNMCCVNLLDVIPAGSRIITSDDVFDFMLDIRALNEGIPDKRKAVADEFLTAKYAQFQLKAIADYDRLKQINKARSLTQSKYIRSEVMGTIVGQSNGETAFRYFVEKIGENGLFLLDEPENSLSPKRQLELKSFIEDSVRYFGCQFILSTHSPFLLSIEQAKIYDLDVAPAAVRRWTELENVKVYYDFFDAYKEDFIGR